MTRNEVERWAEENDVTLVILDGLDDAIVGIASDGLECPKVVYSKSKVVDALVSDGMTRDEALDWYCYNTLRSLPYMGKEAPIFLEEVE